LGEASLVLGMEGLRQIILTGRYNPHIRCDEVKMGIAEDPQVGPEQGTAIGQFLGCGGFVRRAVGPVRRGQQSTDWRP
jgi:hypothetical protein